MPCEHGIPFRICRSVSSLQLYLLLNWYLSLFTFGGLKPCPASMAFLLQFSKLNPAGGASIGIRVAIFEVCKYFKPMSSPPLQLGGAIAYKKIFSRHFLFYRLWGEGSQCPTVIVCNTLNSFHLRRRGRMSGFFCCST